MSILGIISTFSKSYEAFLVVRFFEGFFFTASVVIVWVLASECVAVKQHSIAATIFGCFWVCGYCSVGILTRLVPGWMVASWCVAAPSAVLSLVQWRSVPESFHFLAEHDKSVDLRAWLRKASPNVFHLSLINHIGNDNVKKRDLHQFLSFIKENMTYLGYLGASAVIWIISFMIYMGMSMYSVYLGGDVYYNYILSGLVELPAYFMAPLLLDKLGRRATFISVNLFNGILFIILAFINYHNRSVFITTWMVTKMGVAGSFMYLFVYGGEIFPTVIRNSAMGICAVCSNLGATIGPHVRHTESYISTTMFKIIFFIVCAFIMTSAQFLDPLIGRPLGYVDPLVPVAPVRPFGGLGYGGLRGARIGEELAVERAIGAERAVENAALLGGGIL
ncbi:unnamed protein product [Bursaphelenchus okinawaensis]|uniref:Major facilitator superfamily (MFS) profile domain-containing protein n=1 Tax=Bursaphelenchus okinawaensis TaxID=465554 RepID=A0A811KW52_9BILA|nr:unnamed protein product [Bursaphelenchus okinawaensis]CAG9114255.1 unnamed protein product [Bursaphelenchus okinawaensis]